MYFWRGLRRNRHMILSVLSAKSKKLTTEAQGHRGKHLWLSCVFAGGPWVNILVVELP